MESRKPILDVSVFEKKRRTDKQLLFIDIIVYSILDLLKRDVAISRILPDNC